MKTFNWGIIGPGRIARKFADDLRLLPNARLHAVASSSLERAEAFASAYGAPHFFGSYEALVGCPDLDVVYVATPHVGHCENTLLCLENGLPVLCEKPLAMNLAEVRQMTETARRKGVFLMEALWTCFVPAVEKAFQLIENEEIGRVHTVVADFGFRAPFDPEWRVFKKSLGGGSLLDVGMYPLLLSQLIFGKPAPENIFATAAFTETGVDESCAMVVRFPGQKLALLHSSIASNTPLAAHIYGEKGTITLHRRWHHAKKLSVSRFDDERRTEDWTDVELPYEGWGYTFEAAHVMDCLEKGLTESPKAPLRLSEDLSETLDVVRRKIGMEYDSERHL